MVEYTIVMANYNMEATIDRAIQSIDGLIDDRFEILVIDDGSNDGSVDIVRGLAKDRDRIRLVQDSKPYLYEVRASAVNYAEGDYILHQLDADDEYQCCILDCVEIFHQIEEQVEFDPFLSGAHIHMGSKCLLREVNYRNLGYGGDRDHWRRMIVCGSFIGLHHKPIKRSIGYDRDLRKKVEARFEAIVTQLRSGISPRSYARWLVRKLSRWRPGSGPDLGAIAFNFASLPLAVAVARCQRVYDVPPGLSDMAEVEQMLKDHKMTLSDIESVYDVHIDRSRLSERGKEVYDIEAGEHPGPRFWLGERADVAANRERMSGATRQ